MAANLLKPLLTLVGVTAVSQGIAILCSPVLSRLYTPDQFGTYGAVIAAGTLLSVAATARLEMAIVVPDDPRDASAIALVTGVLATLVCVAAALLWATLQHSLPWTAVRDAPTWTGYIAIAFGWLTALLQLGTLYISRLRQYGRLAVSNVIQQTGTALMAMLLGVLALPANGLLVARLITQTMAAAVFAIRPAAIARAVACALRLPWSTYRALLWRFRAFAIYTTPATLLIAVSREFLILAFTFFSQPAAAGAYALTRMVLLAAPQFLSAAIGQVFYREAVAHIHDPSFGHLAMRFLHILARLSLPLFIILMLWGTELFSLVFGHQWAQAGEFAMWLAPSAFLALLNSWCGRTFEAHEKQAKPFVIQAVFDGLSVSLVLTLLILGHEAATIFPWYGIIQAAYQLSLTVAITNLLHPGIRARLRLIGEISALGVLAIGVHLIGRAMQQTNALTLMAVELVLALALSATALPGLVRQIKFFIIEQTPRSE